MVGPRLKLYQREYTGNMTLERVSYFENFRYWTSPFLSVVGYTWRLVSDEPRTDMKGDIPRLPLHSRVSNGLDQNAY